MKYHIIIYILANYPVEGEKIVEQNYVGMISWKLYFYGSCHSKGNKIGMLTNSPKG